jgi:hypothetical protein
MMPRLRWSPLVGLAFGLASACKPDLGSPASLVVGPRILAVRATPAEATPGSAVAFDVLAVDPAGAIAAPTLTWSFCHSPKPPAEANAVSKECLTTPDEAGPTPMLTTTLPADGCMQFGPQTPPVKPGQPPVRPRDPDVTGGFYQPLRVTLQDDAETDLAFELERITCLLANAPVDVSRTFNTTYTANANPTVERVTLDPAGAATPLLGPDAATDLVVTAGTRVTLEVGWPDSAVESYPVWDLSTRTLVTHREAMRVSWFASAGLFDRDTTGRGEEEAETFAQNSWQAPAESGPVHFWVVLRDARGGLDFGGFDLTVSP